MFRDSHFVCGETFWVSSSIVFGGVNSTEHRSLGARALRVNPCDFELRHGSSSLMNSLTLRNALISIILVLAPASCSSSGAGTDSVPCPAGHSECTSPTAIGAVNGDKAGPSLTYQGTGQAWLSVRVNESVSEWSGKPMRLRGTLAGSSKGEVSVYLWGTFSEFTSRGNAWPDAGPPVPCSETSEVSGTQIGEEVVLQHNWGEVEGESANGSEDGRTVVFEVRPTFSGCAVPWSLVVEGG